MRASRTAVDGMKRVRDWCANPWGQPRFLGVVTWAYMVWAIVPVVIAILFSFNDGRSRSVWQGFSTRWYWGDPNQSSFTTRRCAARSSRASSWRRSTC